MILVSLAMAAAAGAEVDVRLWSSHPPLAVTVSQGGRATRVTAAALSQPLAISGSYVVRAEGGEEVRWAGSLRVSAERGRLRLVARMPREEYVAGVLAGESGGFRSGESLRAMAVAARSFAVHFRGRHRADGFDLCDTTHCQDFRASGDVERMRPAVDATEGELLWYRGSPAAAYYTQDCGGSSEDASVVWPGAGAPYLVRRADPYCSRIDWKAEIRKSGLGAAAAVSSRTASGRVAHLRLDGRLIPAAALRFQVGREHGWNLLRSDWYQIEDAGDRFLFRGRGAGHGVGMCQAGAARMGEQGRGYRQILAFYYPGAAVGVTAQGIPWQVTRGERVELWATQPDGALIAMADRISAELEQRTGLRFAATPRIRLYPAVATFRDATGEPGWVTASTRGRTIRLQPAGRNPSTLRHELAHVLTDRPGLPLWFREGLAEYLVTPAPGLQRRQAGGRPNDALFTNAKTHGELRRAYNAARDYFTALVRQHGERTVLSWVDRGIPAQ